MRNISDGLNWFKNPDKGMLCICIHTYVAIAACSEYPL